MPFPTTRTSVMLALASDDAADRARAFDTIAEIYWRPLYKYARVAHARAPVEAEDLTQGFLTRVLERDALGSFDPARGSFRTFLRVLFDRHVANEVKAASRVKRGGGTARVDLESVEAELEPDSGAVATPEEYFQREWVRAVFSLAVVRVQSRMRAEDFALFEAYDLEEHDPSSYRDLAERFGIPVTTVTNRLSAARRQFRHSVLEVLREATASESEYRAEVRALLGIET